MEQTLATAIEKLVRAGEHAGLSVDEMIGLLQAGLSIGALLDLIEVRLTASVPRLWVM
jgi:hypothetical protein